jgi:hypothetical protein
MVIWDVTTRTNILYREAIQGSISPTLYMQLLRQQSCASKVQTSNDCIKKLRVQLAYVKAARKTLVKLTLGFPCYSWGLRSE